MAIWDLFSKRERRRERQGQEDVFQYTNLPKGFRVQVIHILRDALGEARPGPPNSGHLPNQWWSAIHKAMTREKGVFNLSEQGDAPFLDCQYYLLNAATLDALDIIEVSFNAIDYWVRTTPAHMVKPYRLMDPDDAISELNGRLREHGIGYEYANRQIVRVDSKYLHAEAVKPALLLLHGAGKQFTGPLQEFLSAHKHYREGKQKEALVDALKAFESTMKAVCTMRGWPFDPHKDTAKNLIDIVFSKGLIAPYLQQHFSALRSVLEAGLPTVRNKNAGHGQGPTPTAVPDYLVSYGLHMAAANIVLLMQAHKEMP